MKFWLQKLVIFCLSTVLVLCQFPISGPCPRVTSVTNVTAESLTGVWFISATIPYFFQIYEKCGFFNFTQLTSDSDSGMYSFEKHYVHNLTGIKSVYYGKSYVKPNGQVVLGYDVDGNTYPISYEIVEVKSDTIILYACHECGFFSEYGKGIYIIVLTKLQYPSCETTEAALTFVVNMGISRDFIVMQDQNDCPNC